MVVTVMMDFIGNYLIVAYSLSHDVSASSLRALINSRKDTGKACNFGGY